MKKVRSAVAAAIVILALGQLSSAADRFQASVNFLMAYPQNDFRNNVDRTIYGLSGECLYQLPKSPFSVGISLEYLNYGSETRTAPFNADIPDVWVDVTTRNSIFSAAAVLRLSPPGGPFRPYVEGLIGFNYLFTYTSIRDADSWSEDIATTTNFDDWALTYGAGAGAILRALDIRNRRARSVFSLYFEIGLRYVKGGTAEYLGERSILHDSGSSTYTPLISTTDLVKTHIGVVFRF
ncbi:MAG: outer membrane beta-barrel protein [Candidatus Aminicenantales bacterium]